MNNKVLNLQIVKSFFVAMTICFIFTSCGSEDIDSELENEEQSQWKKSEEILVNSINRLKLYEDSKYQYYFCVNPTYSSGGESYKMPYCYIYPYYKNDGDTDYHSVLYSTHYLNQPQKVNGKWPCGMKYYSADDVNKVGGFDSFSEKLTNYTEEPVWMPRAWAFGGLFTVYVLNAEGRYLHFKIGVNDRSFDRDKGIPSEIKYLKVVYQQY